ncbi:hypothetical protein DSC45_24150 [Streptomyces sp. YIM 130001]|nr:hypothetical protein DSC45_24150 [Streptomyces sp. YIM 130001]
MAHTTLPAPGRPSRTADAVASADRAARATHTQWTRTNTVSAPSTGTPTCPSRPARNRAATATGRAVPGTSR